MTRLLFILPNLNGGGAERVALNLLRHLPADRFQITLFLIKKEGIYWDEVPDNVKVVCATRWGRPPYILPLALAKLLPIAREHDIIVGALELSATFLAYAAGRVLGKRVLGWVHINLPVHMKRYRAYYQVAVKHIYRHLDDVVFVSADAMQSTKTWLNRDVKGWKAIPNIFDAESYAGKQNSPMVDEDEIFSQPVIMSVGRLNKQKQFDLLIAVHAELRQRGLPHNLLILGEGSDRAELTDLAIQHGVADSVFMPGFVANPLDYLKRANVYVLTSRYEGFPTVLLEALTCELPVVAVDCPYGPADILKDGHAGMLVPVGDTHGLVDAIQRLLQDQALCTILKTRGLQRMANFSPQKIAEQWSAIFEGMT